MDGQTAGCRERASFLQNRDLQGKIPTTTCGAASVAASGYRDTRYDAATTRDTLGQIRGHGCRDLLVYCESLWCSGISLCLGLFF
jgi:hypothetical protein